MTCAQGASSHCPQTEVYYQTMANLDSRTWQYSPRPFRLVEGDKLTNNSLEIRFCPKPFQIIEFYTMYAATIIQKHPSVHLNLHKYCAKNKKPVK